MSTSVSRLSSLTLLAVIIALCFGMFVAYSESRKRADAERFLHFMAYAFHAEGMNDHIPFRVPLGHTLALADLRDWRYPGTLYNREFTNVVGADGNLRSVTRFGNLELRIETELVGEVTNVVVVFRFPSCGVEKKTPPYGFTHFQELFLAKTGTNFVMPTVVVPFPRP
ncbi:MAG: hypothetical protein JNN07_29315 [Verrucomicrobiales bacterium]|nr:hypothetical protein [Verrucomicrobiales bacterium]